MVVVWRVTTACNLGCGFCAFDQRLNRERRDADPAAVLVFAKILGAWGRKLDHMPLVSWMGGEPLLWPPLKELTLILHRQYGLRISATTNATPLADAEMRRHILENYAELTISVDGVGKRHDDLRDWPGGYPWLARHVALLAEEKKMDGRGPKLRANVVIMRDTLDGLEMLCSDLAQWGIEEITFNQLGGQDRPEFYPDHRLLPIHAQRLATLLPRLRQTFARQGVRIRGAERYLERIGASADGRLWPVGDCRPGGSFLFVNEAGRVAPCSFTVGACGVPVDAISSVKAMTDLPNFFARAIETARPPACGDCLSTQVFGKFGEA
ncbi:MAG: radical SAM protein [Desulfatitalea sp.]